MVVLQFQATPYAQLGKAGVMVVSNNTHTNYPQKVISIPWQEFSKRFNTSDTSLLVLVDSRTKKQLPLQFETLGKTQIQNLLIQVDVPAMKTIYLKVVQQKRKPFPSKTFGRFVPERKDDFAWENDHIAFRMYGKALQHTNENAHGIDVWVKKSGNLVINERYRRNDYHEDHGDGLDYYGVGNTMGAGNAAPYFNDSVWYPGNFSSWQILDKGPLRITFQLQYDSVNMGGHWLSSVKTISLDAGSWLNKITVEYQGTMIDSLPFIIGLAKRKAPAVMLLNEQKGIIGYWEPAHPAHGSTGTAVVTDNNSIIKIWPDQLVLINRAAINRPFTYYAGACWDKEGVMKNDQMWFAWLNNYKLQLSAPLKISFN